MKTFTAIVEEDLTTGDSIIPLSNDVINELGWQIGDTLSWTDNKDGSFTLHRKQIETELVLVEAVQTYRMRYVVEVPKGKTAWADDIVTMHEASEFSQLDLGEQIISSRVVTEKEVLDLCDVDNDYLSSWSSEMKLKTFITPWKEQNGSETNDRDQSQVGQTIPGAGPYYR